MFAVCTACDEVCAVTDENGAANLVYNGFPLLCVVVVLWFSLQQVRPTMTDM